MSIARGTRWFVPLLLVGIVVTALSAAAALEKGAWFPLPTQPVLPQLGIETGSTGEYVLHVGSSAADQVVLIEIFAPESRDRRSPVWRIQRMQDSPDEDRSTFRLGEIPPGWRGAPIEQAEIIEGSVVSASNGCLFAEVEVIATPPGSGVLMLDSGKQVPVAEFDSRQGDGFSLCGTFNFSATERVWFYTGVAMCLGSLVAIAATAFLRRLRRP